MRIDASSFEKAAAHESFGANAWLTFYLEGMPEKHLAMRPELSRLGAVNLAGEEGGTVYAKVPVKMTLSDIEARIKQVWDVSEMHGIVVGVFDLDSSTDVQTSKFFTLWLPGSITQT